MNSVKNKLLLSVAFEFLWFAFAAIAAYLLVLPIRSEISDSLFLYMMWSLFVVFSYFRFIAFMSNSILLESVWVKLAIFIANVPFFFFVLDQYYAFGRVFDEYNFTLASNIFQHIKSGTELDDLMYIKKLVTFCGIASMTVIVLLQVRIVYAIFKLRQIDHYLYKKKGNLTGANQ